MNRKKKRLNLIVKVGPGLNKSEMGLVAITFLDCYLISVKFEFMKTFRFVALKRVQYLLQFISTNSHIFEIITFINEAIISLITGLNTFAYVVVRFQQC